MVPDSLSQAPKKTTKYTVAGGRIELPLTYWFPDYETGELPLL